MQLKPAASPDWLIPCDGLRVQMRPVSTPVMVEARHLYRHLHDIEIRLDQGDQAEPDAKLPLNRVQYLMTVAMVAAGAIQWDGLHDEGGGELAVPSVEQVKQLLDAEPAIYDWFDAVYCSPLYLLLAEKKGSRRLQTGTTSKTDPASAAPATSDTATPKTPAPTTNTSRKPDKAA